jgi:hypothetical protein
MTAPSKDVIGVTDRVVMEVYYDRASRSWWAFYADREGYQIGDAWFGFTRDEVLVHRPAMASLQEA